jgi:hypothetical protein
MRPSPEVIEALDIVLFGNASVAADDFEHWFSSIEQEVPQELVNMLFSAYTSGMITVMRQDSIWNKNFKLIKEEDGSGLQS